MPTPLVVLFYAWLLVSVVLLIRRLVSRGARTKTPMAPRDPAGSPRIPWSPPSGGAAEIPTTPPVMPPTTPPAQPPTTPAVTPIADRPPPAAPAGSSRHAGAPSLMEALAGISLPCDLMPLTTVEGRVLTDREVLLMTRGYPPETVGSALGEALEQIGYQVTRMGGNDAIAARGPDRIRVTVHGRPDTVLVGRKPAFPTAASDSVLVELKL